ncbi:MAG: two-component system response regulator [Chloroflexota bacterium]
MPTAAKDELEPATHAERETRVNRILIADDDPSIVQLLTDYLTDEGYEVVPATQSLRIFDRAKESRPDLILLDIMMPYLDGFDQLKLFSLDPELRDIPVIVITAKVGALEGVQDLRRLRIVDYLYKPFDMNELLQKIKKVLPS